MGDRLGEFTLKGRPEFRSGITSLEKYAAGLQLIIVKSYDRLNK